MPPSSATDGDSPSHEWAALLTPPVVVSTVEVTAIIARENRKPEAVPEDGESFLRTTQLTVPGTTEPVEVPIHVRERLGRGDKVHGPALIAEKYATTLVLPGRTASLDDDLNLIIEPQS